MQAEDRRRNPLYNFFDQAFARAFQLASGHNAAAVQQRATPEEQQAQQQQQQAVNFFTQQAANQSPQLQANVSPYAVAEPVLTELFPGVRITGRQRTPERNGQVRGSPNSWHVRGEANGVATFDLDHRSLPQGTTINDVASALQRRGFQVVEALDETSGRTGTGPHFHIAVRPPQVAPGSNLFAAMSPAQAQAYVPQPVYQANVDLPDAPQLQAAPNRPNLQGLDPAALDELAAALKVPSRDGSRDPWERFQALLEGAASGAANAGPNASVGQLILAAGAGAAGGNREQREAQRLLDMQIQDAQRQAAIMLANAGLDVRRFNLGVDNTNLDRGWQSQVDATDVANQNATNRFNTLVQEILANSGINQNNVGITNQLNMARANAGLQAAQGQYAARNQGVQLATQLQLNAGREEALGRPTAQFLADAGVPETPQTVQAAAALRVGNAAGTLGPLAQEMITSGWYEQILGEADVAAIQQLMQRDPENGASRAAAYAQQKLAEFMRTPEEQQNLTQWIELMRQAGLPVSTLIAQANNG